MSLRNLLLPLILISLTGAAQAAVDVETFETKSRDISTQAIKPEWQNRPMLALAGLEQKREPKNRTEITMDRASRACNLLKLPSGSYRSRRAESVITGQFDRRGKIVLLDKKSDGSISARLASVGSDERPEVLSSMRCVGVR